jgi:hypothetical protein
MFVSTNFLKLFNQIDNVLDICDTHMELSNLINVTKINHLDMNNYDFNVTFDDVAILK